MVLAGSELDTKCQILSTSPVLTSSAPGRLTGFQSMAATRADFLAARLAEQLDEAKEFGDRGEEADIARVLGVSKPTLRKHCGTARSAESGTATTMSHCVGRRLAGKDQPRARAASSSLSLEDTSSPWSADAARPECGHCWRRPRDSEPPGHGAHLGPMCRAAENHSRNPS